MDREDSAETLGGSRGFAERPFAEANAAMESFAQRLRITACITLWIVWLTQDAELGFKRGNTVTIAKTAFDAVWQSII